MKKQSNVAYILRISLTLLLITGVVAVLLAGVNMITKDRIAAITKEKTEKAVAEVMPYYCQNPTEIEFSDDTGLVKKAYRSEKYFYGCIPFEGDFWAYDYAVEVVPSGFDGEITMMVGVDRNGQVTGISIISHTETAGLGAIAAANNAKGEAFRKQFVGMSGQLAVSKDGGEVDAITGATITSRAVTEGVNAALACVDNFG